MASTSSVLLPTDVRPLRYSLAILPDLPSFTFKGVVSILIKVNNRQTSSVVFHAEELEINKAILTCGSSTFCTDGTEESSALALTFNASNSTASLSLRSGLPFCFSDDEAKLFLEYVGKINNNMTGFYRASYSVPKAAKEVGEGEGAGEEKLEKRWMATTQFEAIGARQAFPCWDEPAVKAVFSLTLLLPNSPDSGSPSVSALSNMPIVFTLPVSSLLSKKEGEGEKGEGDARNLLSLSSSLVLDGQGKNLTAVHFDDTPTMSTYLLAFVVGEVEGMGRKIEGTETEVNVYTTPGKRDQGAFALDVACKLIPFFTDYFGIKYPLPKADLIAIPDFAAGAMENWGLITFRETALLIDEKNSSAAAKQRAAYVVSHELAHQWFGNLVTMEWWTDLWLNEGFATWVGTLGVDFVEPEWNIWTQFVADDLNAALVTDSLLGSHPVEVPINDPKEIDQVFDALSYRKGASVIRQLEAAIGEEDFKKGLNLYLTRHQYGNTRTTDLWNALSLVSNKPVREMMSSWTTQTGYPLLTLSLSPSPACESDAPASSGGVQIKQNRFLSKGKPSEEEDQQLWWVPVSGYLCEVSETGMQKTPIRPFVLSERSKKLDATEFLAQDNALYANSLLSSLLSPSPSAFLKLNAMQTGIFRVNYEPVGLWRGVERAVREMGESVDESDRLGILMDAFALAKSGILKTSDALSIALAFESDKSYTVWNQLSKEVSEVDLLLSSSPDPSLYSSFQKIMARKLYSKIAERVGWEAKGGESHLTSMLRPLVLGKLAHCEHKETVDECMRRFKDMQQDLDLVHPDLRGLVLSASVSHGAEAEFEAAQRLYLAAPTQYLKMQCLQAMGQTRQLPLVRQFIEFGLNEDNVKGQDSLYVFMAASGNPAAREEAWNFLKENWEQIYTRFKPRQSLLKYIVSLPLSGFSSFSHAEDCEEFFAANPVPEASMEIARSLEKIKTRAAWMERDGEDVREWVMREKVVQ